MTPEKPGQPAPSRWRYAFGLLCIFWLAASIVTSATPACSQTNPTNSTTCDNKETSPCSLCLQETSGMEATGSVLGSYMINQMFMIINNMLNKIQTTFYTGIINSAVFQNIVNVCFLVYIAVYGAMIMLNLASYRSDEMVSRLVKLAIIYALTSANSWTYFSTFIELPVINEMNELITTMGNAASGSGGMCSSAAAFSGAGPISGAAGGADVLTVTLSTGPMAMLNGPMTCVFASQFVATFNALITSASFGWLIALALLWGMVEFSKMVLGAIVTYVKAIIGLTILFGIAPLFFAFYLFEKTRKLTMAWFSMVFGFALQPVMLFAFLAIFATMVGTALTNMMSDANGNPIDICYVPWYEMPNMFEIYWQKFAHSGAAGGAWNFPSGGSGADEQLPVQVLNVLYFVVLCNLGKNFCEYINELSNTLTGGGGSTVTTSRDIERMTGAKSIGQSVQQGAGSFGRMLSGGKSGGSGSAPTLRNPSRPSTT